MLVAFDCFERSPFFFFFFFDSFSDSEVLAPDFKTKLVDVARVARPFVHWYVDSLYECSLTPLMFCLV